VAIAAPQISPPADPENPSPYKELEGSFFQLPTPPEPGVPLGSVPRPPIVAPGIPSGQGASHKWDVFHTLIWGTRSALRYGLVVAVATAILGTLIGAISGYLGGPFGGMTMRVTDAFLAFPAIAAIWVLERTFFSGLNSPFGLSLENLTPLETVLLGLQIDSIMIAFILFSWMPYARIVNTTVSQIRRADYILAAESLGARGARVLFRHIVPNAISPAIVMVARDIGAMVILAAAFIFIGIGSSKFLAWGVVLVGGRDYIIGKGGNPFAYWWTFLPISLALILFSVGWNLLGDGLNHALNPRSRR
jgi:peptide/nickel transport system permease protein